MGVDPFTGIVFVLWVMTITLFVGGAVEIGIISGIITFIITVIWWILFFIVASKTKSSSTKDDSSSSLVGESDLQNGIANFSWREMEELTGKLFEKKGYSVEVTKSTGDFGIDVWAKKDNMITGIQVKKWKNDVGFDDVTKTLGSNLGKANKYILISTISFFTPQAWQHQKQHSHLIELWDTNRFRKELRDNFVKLPNSNKPVTPHQDDKIDSFDYDQGFNIDEVYNEQNNILPEIGEKCTKCGSPVFRNFCGSCGKEHKSKEPKANSKVPNLKESDNKEIETNCRNCNNVSFGNLCKHCGRVK